MVHTATSNVLPAAFRMVALPCIFLLRTALAGEIISDLASIVAPSPADERRALEIKAEHFWKTVLTAAEDIKMTEHLALYESAEQVVKSLPPENEYVRRTLTQALERLKRADDAVFAQAVRSSSIASDKLTSPGGEKGWSFFSAGQNVFKEALRRFTAGSRYGDRLLEHVGQRQADILPILQGAAGSAGDVLKDARLASKLAFDVLKYDIYNKGVPKTPQNAKDVANKLVDSVAETRHNFMQFVTKAVNGITQDYQGRYDDATATVARSAFRDAEAQQASPPGPFVNF